LENKEEGWRRTRIRKQTEKEGNEKKKYEREVEGERE